MSITRWLAKVKEAGAFKGPLDWLRIAADGNLFVTITEKGPTGRLVGTDHVGNRYYEDESAGYTRKRWVIYADGTTYNPTSVPPEWHGWLNYINDVCPANAEFKRPIYAIEATVSKTGTAAAYAPKGSWTNPDKRAWLKYESWTPPGSGKAAP
jgi:NADH dehydrogenase (ubiquinone) 1 alpha subcomplex subunit 12